MLKYFYIAIDKDKITDEELLKNIPLKNLVEPNVQIRLFDFMLKIVKDKQKLAEHFVDKYASDIMSLDDLFDENPDIQPLYESCENCLCEEKYIFIGLVDGNSSRDSEKIIFEKGLSILENTGFKILKDI
jgi:hypothetical protein